VLLAYSMTLNVQTASATAGQIFKMVTNGGGSTFYQGRCFRVDFYVQTDSMDVNSADLVVPYNSTLLEPHSNSSCTSVATDLETDGLFPSYPGAGNKIEDDTLKLTGVDSGGSDPVNTGSAPSDSLYAHIFFKVLTTSGSYNLAFDFTLASTTDTNMAENGGDGSDVLDSVENLTLALLADTEAPDIDSVSPAEDATGVSVTSNLSFVLTDSGAGINSSSVSGTLSGSALSVSVSGCSTTDSNRVPSCNGSADLGTMNYNAYYTLTITGGDLATTTNTGSRVWQFTTEDDTDAPYVENQSPAANATGVSTGSNVVFRVKDYKDDAGVTAGLGVDISTVQVTVTGAGITTTTYTTSDGEFGSSGTSEDYTITIDPAVVFPENTRVYVNIAASDLHSTPNVMTAVQYSFLTIDSQGPQISSISPAAGATGVAADTNLTFTVSDVGAGIDISNTTITVEGTAYSTSDAEFTYTGTSASYDVTYNPASNFSGNQEVNVTINTQDLASPTPNTDSSTYSFVISSACSTCSVDTEDPERFDRSATIDDSIVFHIKDTGDGISSSTISAVITGSGNAVPVNPVTYTGASAEMDISGTSADYTVTITLPAAISENTSYSITINANDINALAMSTVSYTFMRDTTTTTTTTVAAVCPECASCNPAPAGGGRRGSGGGNTERIASSIRTEDLPQIIARRRLPGYDTLIEEVLSTDLALQVDRCYIDDDGTLHAAPPRTHYRDVEPGVWYEGALSSLLEAGILDSEQTMFRGSDPALRAEMAKLLVVTDGSTVQTPAVPSFTDANTEDWFYGFIETAAQHGWIRGYGNCYGQESCTARPAARITRAEAATLIVRLFTLSQKNLAPEFTDNSTDAWYNEYLQIAADNCIVQGNNDAALAFPNRNINRAEMAVMIERARQEMEYGTDCTWGEEHSGQSAFLENQVPDTSLTASLIGGTTASVTNFTVSSSTPKSMLIVLLSSIALSLLALYGLRKRNEDRACWHLGQ
jgi:hypothetical protein